MPEPLASGGDEFLLRVKGDSMIDAGILDGDYVVVRRQQDARNGEIVVALAGDDESADEATVKRFFREGGRVRLQPENDALEPIYADHVQVLGKVIGVFRSADERRAARTHARPGARRARSRSEPRVPRLRRVRAAAAGGAIVCPECGSVLARGRRDADAGYNRRRRPGDRGPAFRLGARKVRTPQGRTLGKPQAAKADGKWHRKETATGDAIRDAGGKGETVG